MCRLRPYDWLPIPSGQQKKAFSRSWCAIITCCQLSPLHNVSHGAKFPNKSAKCFSRPAPIRHEPLLIVWHSLTRLRHRTILFEYTPCFSVTGRNQRPPCCKLHDVFHADNPWLYRACPLDYNPCQASNLFADRLSALRPTEMLTVWRKMSPPYRSASARLSRVYFPNILVVMLGIRMVLSVHSDSSGIMVDSNVHGTTYCKFKSCAPPTATTKTIHCNFICEACLSLHLLSLLPPTITHAQAINVLVNAKINRILIAFPAICCKGGTMFTAPPLSLILLPSNFPSRWVSVLLPLQFSHCQECC